MTGMGMVYSVTFQKYKQNMSGCQELRQMQLDLFIWLNETMSKDGCYGVCEMIKSQNTTLRLSLLRLFQNYQ